MKKRAVFFLLFALWSNSAFSQLAVPGGEPVPFLGVFSVSGIAGNTYNTSTGELLLPSVASIGGGAQSGLIYSNVVFKLADDGRFDLIEFDETTPEEECTVDEVSAAIPQLNLTLSLEEAELLIGCNARIVPGAADLELGRTVTASWQGGTIQPGPAAAAYYSPFGSPLVLTYFNFGYGSFGSVPVITLSFLEGNLTQYSYSEGSPTTLCQATHLSDNFNALTPSLSYDQMVEVLNCNGNLSTTIVNAEGIEEVYVWTALNAAEPAEVTGATSNTYETVTGRFLNGIAQSIDFRGSESFNTAAACSVLELTTAHTSIQVGDSEMEMLDLVPCQPDSVTTSIAEGITSITYTWRTDNISPSIFVTTNRIIFSIVVDGSVSSITIYRT